MIHQKKNEASDDFEVVLIDYGYAKKYRDENGDHLPQDEMDNFQGNLIFASKHTLSFKRPSRRDDLISLGYLFIFLLNGCDIPLLSDYMLENVDDPNID